MSWEQKGIFVTSASNVRKRWLRFQCFGLVPAFLLQLAQCMLSSSFDRRLYPDFQYACWDRLSRKEGVCRGRRACVGTSTSSSWQMSLIMLMTSSCNFVFHASQHVILAKLRPHCFCHPTLYPFRSNLNFT